jgi:hypothetical protein
MNFERPKKQPDEPTDEPKYPNEVIDEVLEIAEQRIVRGMADKVLAGQD